MNKYKFQKKGSLEIYVRIFILLRIYLFFSLAVFKIIYKRVRYLDFVIFVPLFFFLGNREVRVGNFCKPLKTYRQIRILLKFSKLKFLLFFIFYFFCFLQVYTIRLISICIYYVPSNCVI